MDHDHSPTAESPGVVDRPQTDRGLLGRIVPLFALALMLLMVMQSCLSTSAMAPAAAPAASTSPAGK